MSPPMTRKVLPANAAVAGSSSTSNSHGGNNNRPAPPPSPQPQPRAQLQPLQSQPRPQQQQQQPLLPPPLPPTPAQPQQHQQSHSHQFVAMLVHSKAQARVSAAATIEHAGPRPGTAATAATATTAVTSAASAAPAASAASAALATGGSGGSGSGEMPSIQLQYHTQSLPRQFVSCHNSANSCSTGGPARGSGDTHTLAAVSTAAAIAAQAAAHNGLSPEADHSKTTPISGAMAFAPPVPSPFPSPGRKRADEGRHQSPA